MLFVTVNVAGVGDPAAENSVMAPVGVLHVTPVVRLVPCVTVPPAPAMYPNAVVVEDHAGALLGPCPTSTPPVTGHGPVPPRAVLRIPVHPAAMVTGVSNDAEAAPPKVNVTLVSLKRVNAEPVIDI